MTKCDFCTKSDTKGKCFWSSQINRERDCEKAIEKMSNALNGIYGSDKKVFIKENKHDKR